MAHPLIAERKQARLLSPGVKQALDEYFIRRAFELAECLMKDGDHGPKSAEPPVIPHIRAASRSVVYYGDEFHGSYNHHNQIGKFKGLYYFAWSNGFRNEEDAGQRVLVASSPDGRAWGAPSPVVEAAPGTAWAHNCVALSADAEHMHVVVMSEETEHDETVTGMRRIKPEDAYIDVYRSSDGRRFEKAFSYGKGIKWIFEAPRPVAQGGLLCLCTTKKDGPAALLWPDGNMLSMPQVIPIAEPEGAWFPYGESTWYQLDSGRIMAFWRDEGMSCRLYWNFSDDGGRSWSAPILTDIPDSMSRAYAGRLADGRYFLVNNAVPILLDRRALTMLVSDDGACFDKVFMINDSPAEMRRLGLLKANGHQYPCCLVDGGRLLVAYDANKEDIMCEVI
ncbi:MAG: exo-alpha-sialidase, partial [Clostridiales bacterium]|nr:exo-alpha-sialidase [Clostridiales bacterium]